MSIVELPPFTPVEARCDYAGFEYAGVRPGSTQKCRGCGRGFVFEVGRDEWGERHGVLSVQDHGRYDGSLGVFCSDFCAGRVFERYVAGRE